MSLIVQKMRGINLYARDSVRPRFYPAATNPTAWVEVWAHDADMPATFQDATLIGTFPPGGSGVLEFNPVQDRPKILRAIAFSAAGVPSVRYLDDAPAITVLFSRTDSQYATNFGDGSSTSFTITHDLDSDDLQVEFRLASGTKRSVGGIVWEPEPGDPLNKIVLTTTVAPATDELRVMIRK